MLSDHKSTNMVNQGDSSTMWTVSKKLEWKKKYVKTDFCNYYNCTCNSNRFLILVGGYFAWKPVIKFFNS